MALDGVTLDFPSQKMIGLIGPDGVGKSTLLSLLAGVRKLQTGTVEVLGGNIADRRFRNSVAARIAYLPQGLGKNLYPTLSIFENVDFFGRLFGQTREEREWRIDDLLPIFAKPDSVYPSGAARAARVTPMLPPAPATFSITTVWPSGPRRPSAMTRAITSSGPPAA